MPLITSIGSNRTDDPLSLAMFQDAGGLLYRGVTIAHPDILHTQVQLTATGDVITGVTGRRIELQSMMVSAANAGSIQLRSGSTVGAARIYLGINQTEVITFANGFWTSGATGEAFGLVLTGITNLGVFVSYRLI